jgi:hypothetical protein
LANRKLTKVYDEHIKINDLELDLTDFVYLVLLGLGSELFLDGQSRARTTTNEMQ